MAKLLALALYAQAIFKTLVVPCVTVPSNWKYCFNDMDQWLYPELVRGWELYTGREVPYSTEKPGILGE